MATIVCTGEYEIPPGFIASGGVPAVVHGCGREIDMPDTPWDVKTDAEGRVVSEHRQVECPYCGVHTFIEKAV